RPSHHYSFPARRRILAPYYRPVPDDGGPSWLTFLGHTKDSLRIVDLLRCESVALRTYWVLVVMDHYTRANHRIWNSSQNRRWSCALPHVQPSDSWPDCSEISDTGTPALLKTD